MAKKKENIKIFIFNKRLYHTLFFNVLSILITINLILSSIGINIYFHTCFNENKVSVSLFTKAECKHHYNNTTFSNAKFACNSTKNSCNIYNCEHKNTNSIKSPQALVFKGINCCKDYAENYVLKSSYILTITKIIFQAFYNIYYFFKELLLNNSDEYKHYSKTKFLSITIPNLITSTKIILPRSATEDYHFFLK